ncbi:MAG: beta-galactosidase [Chitinophagaceae bacterium]|jgi:hypothetical protein|nr:beta-galactosidase [Chitinophagaceae bacterium]
MKKGILFFIIQFAILASKAQVTSESLNRIDLAGEWSFAIDSSDIGIAQQWYAKNFPDKIHLPGSMASNNKGYDVTADTKWTGNFSRSDYYTDPSYAPYRKPGNIKVPFWLQPVKYYAGAAWYTRTVTIPSDWKKSHVALFLERCHWETRLWIDGEERGMRNALGAPHEYALDFLSPGKHRISIRIDNRIKDINPGIDAHSISDNTQTNWNGIVGKLYMENRPLIYVSDVQVFPDIEQKKIRIKTTLVNISGNVSTIPVHYAVKNVNFKTKTAQPEQEKMITVQKDSSIIESELSMGDEMQTWDEFHPNVYSLQVNIGNDRKEVMFGMRSFKANGQVFEVNGRRIFLRGTLECAIFPLTGFPPTDTTAWLRIFKIARSYGLNHLRFHSWCPPEAAFEAADKTGFYLSIECSAWATVGDGMPIDEFIYKESEDIVRHFGNHPSFCMMPYGNEPGGKNDTDYLRAFVNYWKEKDSRRLYTTASGWPFIPENDYNVDPNPRIQLWGAGVKSIINSKPPSADYNWDTQLPSHTIPTVSHEIGQWCVYPNFKERKKYTGVLKAKNFDIFYDKLKEHGMANLADSFLLASGKLQVLCYKADIEAALRTPMFAGFQLLSLYDFPGQGTALVGVLDAFWDNKGYVTPAAYKRFCNETVLLARLSKFIYLNNDTLVVPVEVAHFGETSLKKQTPAWSITDQKGNVIAKSRFAETSIPIGTGYQLGVIHQPLNEIKTPAELTLKVTVGAFENSWNIFVYPSQRTTLNKKPIVTQVLTQTILDTLEKGADVLLTIKKGAIKPEMGGDVAVGFSSIFWNTAWTEKQPPHTLGILCNPAHPALKEFPTEYFSDYQWQYAMSHCNAIRLDSVDAKIKPIVRVIDDWFTARPLGLLFECKVGKGRLLVSGIDLLDDEARRPEAKQLRYSLEKYMISKDFQPAVNIMPGALLKLFN